MTAPCFETVWFCNIWWWNVWRSITSLVRTAQLRRVGWKSNGRVAFGSFDRPYLNRKRDAVDKRWRRDTDFVQKPTYPHNNVIDTHPFSFSTSFKHHFLICSHLPPNFLKKNRCFHTLTQSDLWILSVCKSNGRKIKLTCRFTLKWFLVQIGSVGLIMLK